MSKEELEKLEREKYVVERVNANIYLSHTPGK